MKLEIRPIARNKQTGKELTFLDAIELVRRFCDQRNWRQFHKPKDLAIGVVTEGAELLDLFRFKNEPEVQSLLDNKHTREMVADEMADVQFFLLRMSEVTGIDLVDALRRKIRKNRSKYPVKRARGSNLKYNHR
jgi:NTP pyrophosphatase (non-canonical NTP hydrolase)